MSETKTSLCDDYDDGDVDDGDDGDCGVDGDDGDDGVDGDGNDSYLVFIMPASWLECMGSTNQHSGLLRLGDHADVVLALRLVG